MRMSARVKIITVIFFPLEARYLLLAHSLSFSSCSLLVNHSFTSFVFRLSPFLSHRVCLSFVLCLFTPSFIVCVLTLQSSFIRKTDTQAKSASQKQLQGINFFLNTKGSNGHDPQTKNAEDMEVIKVWTRARNCLMVYFRTPGQMCDLGGGFFYRLWDLLVE